MKRHFRKTRIYAYSLMVSWLTVVWVLLWGDLSWANVIIGALLGVLVTAVFPLPGMDFNGRFRPWHFVNLVAHLAVDLVVTSFQVILQAISPGPRIESVVIRVPLHTHNELLMTAIAVYITLTPGSVIVEAQHSTGDLYVHMLGITTPEEIEEAKRRVFDLEYRIVASFGSKREYALCKQYVNELKEQRANAKELGA